ncbi:MAG: lysophospholipid acyltransferase family protein [Prevotellaceae bacterium]|jgi:predicted LPLAT superfamily acyltransferase|nr:lysophospholipid acyltransferase family protein [Prevotellaceae bacterium]
MDWDGKSKGNKSGYAVFILLLRMGLAPAYALLVFVSLYYCIAERRKSVISYNFYRKRIGFGVLRSVISVCRNYFIFGQCLIDRIALMTANPNFGITFTGENHLTDMAKQGKGGLLVGAHLGNWEIAGHFLYRINVPVNIVMYDNEYENIKEYLESVKNKQNAYRIIPLKDDLSHLYAITEALSRGEFVCLHADRYMDNSKLLYHKFLNEDAPFSQSIFRLCTMFDIPVTFVYAFRLKFRRYHFHASKPKTYSGTKDEKIKEFADDYIRELEKKTGHYPLHWFNFFDFWKKS